MNKPGVRLPHNAFCKYHFDKGLVQGCSPILVHTAIIKAILQREEVQKELGYDPDRGTLARVELITDYLTKIAPLCCWLGDEKMKNVYLDGMNVKGEA